MSAGAEYSDIGILVDCIELPRRLSEFDPNGDRITVTTLNLSQVCIGQTAAKMPDTVALIIDGGKQYSFGELEQRVLTAASAFSHLPLGSRLLITLPDSFEFVLAFFAANAAGMVPIPASSQLTERELRFMAQSATAVIGDNNAPDLGIPLLPLEQLTAATTATGYAATDAESPAYMLFTSGTTSEPKAVLHAQRVILGRKPMHQQWLGLQSGDRLLHAGALNWSYTLGVGLMDPWSCGATAIVCPGGRSAADWPAVIKRHQATIFAAVPGVFRKILKYADDNIARDLSSLRHAATAGEALSPQLFAQWTRTTSKPLYEALGMTECSTYISSGPTTEVLPGSPGKPQQGRYVAILDEKSGDPLADNTAGLLAIHRSERGLMLGYQKDSPESWRGDWFITGDRVMQDGNGYIHHLGRNSDVMNAQGYRVSPQEIEAVLSGCVGIVELAVAETAITESLSLIVAYIVTNEAFDEARFNLHSETNLAAYKQPRAIQRVESLPRTRNGKLRRSELPPMYKPAQAV